MRSVRQWVCVFAGSRDHYQVAWALAEDSRLAGLVTDFYTPDWLVAGLRRFRALSRRLRFENRHCDGVPSRLVASNWPAIIYDFLSRFSRSPQYVSAKDARLGRAAGKMARTNGVGLLAYSYYASYAFDSSPRTKKVIFQVHPHPKALQRIYHEELQRFPAGKWSLLREAELNYPPEAIERLCREATMADYAITPSAFAKQTLLEAGVDANRIAVVPYGISLTAFPAKSRWEKREKLRLIFVGSMIQRKGIGYLLEAMRLLRNEPIELVMVGRGPQDTALMDAYPDVALRRVTGASHEQLIEELRNADVFVLPSLAESFALVLIEAMSVGLPVITTVNTAGPELIKHGETGFIGGIRDVDFLVDKITWFAAHREEIATMGRLCQIEARKRTWERFRKEIREALDRFGARTVAGGVA